MSLSTKHRSHIYDQFVPILGEEAASALLDEFPAAEHDELVTKQFHRAESILLRSEMANEAAAIRSEMATESAALRSEMAELGSALRGEMSELGSALRGEMSELRTELRGEMSELRTELVEKLGAVERRVMLLNGGGFLSLMGMILALR